MNLAASDSVTKFEDGSERLAELRGAALLMIFVFSSTWASIGVMLEAIRARPKYPPDLLAEKRRYTVLAVWIVFNCREEAGAAEQTTYLIRLIQPVNVVLLSCPRLLSFRIFEFADTQALHDEVSFFGG